MIMKAPPLEKFVLVVGVALAFIAGLSLLFCISLVGVAMDKRNSVIQSVGYWPLFTLFLLLLSGCFILGAEPLAKAIGKRKSDEDRSG
jgi:hypothetical protein